ncbi:MAG: hypothetical protein RR880_03735, partial [Bacteroidales bacterium]
MFRKTVIFIGYIILFATLGGYFFFATILEKQGKSKEICNTVKVTLLDSAQNRFVSSHEVIEIINSFMGESVGKRNKEINLNLIEELLNKRSAIKQAQVSLTKDGKMSINITQRRPVLRIQTENGGFYVDDTQYIFPLIEDFTSYVPIVSGYIPFIINAEHRGKALEDDKNWMSHILKMGYFLDENPFWNAQIEQIYVDVNGDILLY